MATLCTICQHDVPASEALRTACGHAYHWPCMLTLFTMHADLVSCPNCRAPVTKLITDKDDRDQIHRVAEWHEAALWASLYYAELVVQVSAAVSKATQMLFVLAHPLAPL